MLCNHVVQHFDAPVVYSASGTECLDDSEDEDSIYVLSDFEGETFQQLCSGYYRVVAPPVVIWAATNGEVSLLLLFRIDILSLLLLYYLVIVVFLCSNK